MDYTLLFHVLQKLTMTEQAETSGETSDELAAELREQNQDVDRPDAETPASGSRRWELGSLRERADDRRILLLQEGSSPEDGLVSLKVLEAALERELALGNILYSITRRLWYEEMAIAERDRAIAEKDMAISAEDKAIAERERAIAEKDMAISAEDKAIAERERTIAEKDMAISAKDKAIAERDGAIAERDMAISAKDMAIGEKDRTILALEEDKKAFYGEMVSVIRGSITILRNVTEQVVDVTVGLEKFKLKNANGETTTIPSAPSSSHEMPTTGTLLACGEEASKRINIAKCALGEAFKQWKKEEAGLQILQHHNRKSLLAKILGKEEPAPICDAGEETTTGLHQVDRI